MIRSKYIYTGIGLTITGIIVTVIVSQFNQTNKNIVTDSTRHRIIGNTEKAIDKISIDNLNHTVVKLQSEFGEIRSELALIHQNLDLLKSMQAVVETSASKTQENHTEVPLSSFSNPEYSQQTEDAQVLSETEEADRIATMDYVMYQLEPDSNWDGQAEEQLRRNIQDANMLNIQLQSITCQGVVCRIEFSHSDGEALFEMLEGDTQVVSWNHKGRTATTIDAMGNSITVMYITREGEEFPQGF